MTTDASLDSIGVQERKTAEIKPASVKRSSVWRTALSGGTGALHEQALGFATPGEKGVLLVDLTAAAAVDGPGLQILIALAADALQKGRHFEIVNAGPEVAALLELAGIGYLLAA
jgi:anti-anti-sigma regulatory factor